MAQRSPHLYLPTQLLELWTHQSVRSCPDLRPAPRVRPLGEFGGLEPLFAWQGESAPPRRDIHSAMIKESNSKLALAQAQKHGWLNQSLACECVVHSRGVQGFTHQQTAWIYSRSF